MIKYCRHRWHYLNQPYQFMQRFMCNKCGKLKDVREITSDFDLEREKKYDGRSK